MIIRMPGFDTDTRANPLLKWATRKVGDSREWTAVGKTEAECVHEMARCLQEVSAGRVPR
jgi:hypothetical protein